MKPKTNAKDGTVEVILHKQDRQTLARAADVLAQIAFHSNSSSAATCAADIRALLKGHAPDAQQTKP